MRAIVAKRLRSEAQGGKKSYVRDKTGALRLHPYSWRAAYQALKRAWKSR